MPELGTPAKLQITLVDCPGHASLIKTVLGGAKIIDLMILVIDITKGQSGCDADVCMECRGW